MALCLAHASPWKPWAARHSGTYVGEPNAVSCLDRSSGELYSVLFVETCTTFSVMYRIHAGKGMGVVVRFRPRTGNAPFFSEAA